MTTDQLTPPCGASRLAQPCTATGSAPSTAPFVVPSTTGCGPLEGVR